MINQRDPALHKTRARVAISSPLKFSMMANSSFNQNIPEEMNETIELCVAGLGGLGTLTGIIGAGTDLPIIAGTWVGMTVKLAAQAGHRLDFQTAKKITLAVSAGVGTMIVGAKAATTVLGWVAAAFTGGLSLLLAAGANATLNATLTYAYGRAAARYFLTTEELSNTEVMISVILNFMAENLGL